MNYGERKIKELKIQTAKIFWKINQQEKKINNNIDNNINNNNIINNNKVDIKSQIEDYIENNCNINWFEFIYNIIKLFKDFAKKRRRYFQIYYGSIFS